MLGLQEARAPLGKGKGKKKQKAQNKDESNEAKRRKKRSEKKERGGETRRSEEEREGGNEDGWQVCDCHPEKLLSQLQRVSLRPLKNKHKSTGGVR